MQEKITDDMISRQAALALAKDLCVPTKDGTLYRHRCIDPDAIRELPAVPPEIKCIAKIMLTEEQVQEAVEKAKKEILAAQPERWTPVTERPPEKMGAYMTTIDYGKHGLVTGQRYYHGALGWEDKCVIAWMPLPEPYRGKKND